MSDATVGVFGGTFNPIHLGHLRAAEEVREQLGLTRVIFVVSARPPHKRAEGEEIIAPAAERLRWVELAVADNPHFEVDAIEVEREGPSFAVDTLRAIGERTHPGHPVFAIGCDAFAELGTWREPERILELAHFAVTTRPPMRRGRLEDCLPDCARDAVELSSDGRSARHRVAGTWIRLVEITALDVSASEIRTRIRAGGSVRYLVPEAAIGAILDSGCYSQAPPRARGVG